LPLESNGLKKTNEDPN